MCKKLIFFALAISVLGMVKVQAQDIEWERAVYWDDLYPTAWQGGGTGVRDGLVAAGYTILNAAELKTWMDARIADKKYSVVVFCRDIVPDTVAETMTATCTIRRYLDAGGKVVWYADIPFYYVGHSGPAQDTWAVAGSTAILGFNAAGAGWDSGRAANITRIGTAWGLTDSWGSVRPALTTDVDTVLADDGGGNAAAWVKHYVPGDRGRGFVRLRDVSGEPSVGDVIRAAEYFPLKAEFPVPDTGATNVGKWFNGGVIQWSSGALTSWHIVYFGTNPTPGAAEERSRQPVVNTFLFPDMYLVRQPDTTYYWRVDEETSTGTIYTGDVWNFTTAPRNANMPSPAD
ncbi:MAG: hypothetical protein JSU94_06460, partial [Phycisphaerales bacterium]